jgi:hypothetical protein
MRAFIIARASLPNSNSTSRRTISTAFFGVIPLLIKARARSAKFGHPTRSTGRDASKRHLCSRNLSNANRSYASFAELSESNVGTGYFHRHREQAHPVSGASIQTKERVVNQHLEGME